MRVRILTRATRTRCSRSIRCFRYGQGGPVVQRRRHALVAALAMERRTGARGLRAIVEKLLLDAMFEILPARTSSVHVTERWCRAPARRGYRAPHRPRKTRRWRRRAPSSNRRRRTARSSKLRPAPRVCVCVRVMPSFVVRCGAVLRAVCAPLSVTRTPPVPAPGLWSLVESRGVPWSPVDSFYRGVPWSLAESNGVRVHGVS